MFIGFLTNSHFQTARRLAFACLIGVLTLQVSHAQVDQAKKEREELEARVRNTLKKNGETLRFLENKGQINNPDVLYYFESTNEAVYVEKDRIRFVAMKDTLIAEEEHEEDEEEGEEKEIEMTRVIVASHTFSLYLPGRNPKPSIKLGDDFGTGYNFFLGEQSDRWTSNARAAKELTLEDIYPGIDLRLYSTSDGSMEFDWVMDAGADFNKVQMQFKGQDGLTIDQKGNLKVGLRFMDVKFNVPESYQVTPEGNVPIAFSYAKLNDQTVQFLTRARVDAHYPLIIDPTLTWGTFMDGNNATFDAYLYAIQVDPEDGMVYCAGGTNRPIPTGSAPYDADGYLNNVSGLTGAPPTPLPMVAVVYRINNAGNDLVDLTFFGPSTAASSDNIVAQALSLSDTKVFIGGPTNVNIPTAGSPFDNSRSSGDGYVAVFSRDLGTLTYATYLGGTGNEALGVTSIRALSDDSFVVGMTANASLGGTYITAGAADGTFSGNSDMYIAKFTNYNTITWGTYVGGTSDETFNDLEVFGDGRVAFAGNGTGQLTEVNSAAGRSTGTDLDGIVGVLNANGTAFNYLDEIGGTGADRINDVEIVGNTLFWTGSGATGFPVSSSGVYDITYNGGATDVIVGKVGDTGGSGTYACTYYGTSSADLGNGIRLVEETDCEGTQTVFLLVFGTVGGAGLPTQNIGTDPFYNSSFTSGGTSNVDMFFAGFNNTLGTLLYGTYMGGNQDDYLGATGVPRGSNHLWVNNANVYLGTTTHSGTHSPTLIANGFDSTKDNGTNDSHIILTINFNTIIESDYSDAPVSYGTPSHILDCQDLHIGPLLDPEAAAFPSVQADGDDNNGLDDEDGILTLPAFSAGGPQTITVTVTGLVNTTGFTANLYGWIDFNGDGQFSTSEFASTTLATGFSGSKVLTWSGVSVSGLGGSHYLRIRLTTNTLTDNVGTASVDERSTVSASTGEVEDYRAIELACPAPSNQAACQTQAAINAAFATWLASVVAGGGCNGVLTNNNTGAPSACGGTTTVIFTYTSSCAPTTTTCSSTFTVATDGLPTLTTCAVTRNIAGCNTSAITLPNFSATSNTSTEAVFESSPNNGNVSDACGITSVTYIDVATGTCPIVVTRTWTFTDACGHQVTCNQTINVNDTTIPTIACPGNVTIACNASTLPANTGTATGGDNCTVSPAVTYTDVTVAGPLCPQEYTITRTWRVTDACGNTNTCNQTITLDDNSPPLITCPADVTIACNANTLPANTGTPITSDNCDATPTLTYVDVTIAPPRPNEYDIIRTWTATDDCGNSSSCTQNIAVLDFSPVNITSQPNNVAECIGGTATMTVVISGGSGTISYQWQSSLNGSSGWVDATGTGATTATYTPPSTVAGTTYYRVVITSGSYGCGGAISNNATAIISPDITITTQPTNLNECVGGTGTITVAISGGSGTITYQWQSSPDGSTGWVVATGTGATTALYTPDSSTPGTTYYRVLVNAPNNGCDQVVSNNAAVVISADIVISTQPTNVNECVGGTNTMTVSVTGGSGTITYQWQSSPDGSTGWANATGTGNTTATYAPPSTVAGTTYYRVLVNAANNGCDQAVSNNAIAVIIADLVVTTQPSNVNECIGGTSTMTIVITGGSGAITYQWQSSSNGTSGWANAVGTGNTTATFTPPSTVAGTTFYRVIISAGGSGCDQVISNNATAVIAADITITSQPTNVDECVGGTSTMTVVISGGSGTISYQWQSSPDGLSGWANATGTGATTVTYTPSSATPGTTFYRVLINAANNGCDQAVSNNAVAVISADIVIVTQPTDINECVGGTDQLTVTITGGPGTIAYQWQSSPNGSGGWVNAVGAGSTSAIYTPNSSVAGTTYYRVLVNAPNNGCDQAISNTSTVVVVADIAITTQPTDVNECVGGTNVMTVSVIGGSGTILYQWQESPNGTSGWTNASGAGSTTSTYTPQSTTPGSMYYRVLINSN